MIHFLAMRICKIKSYFSVEVSTELLTDEKYSARGLLPDNLVREEMRGRVVEIRLAVS